MFKFLEIMKALRYILSMIAVVSVLSISAQTPNYGTTYKPQSTAGIYTQTEAQLPAATIGSTNVGYVQSGSSLPMAAQSGVTTTYDKSPSISRPRRTGEGEGTEDEEDPDNPGEPAPIGDAAIPLALCALAYLIVRVVRKRTRALNC